MFENIGIGLIVSLISFVVGIIFTKLSNIYFIKKPVKRLWRISNEKKLIMCAATSTKTNTGKYIRPATGIGQLRALGQIVESLGKAYDIKIENILLSVNEIQRQIENDLILLGGPKNNDKTKLFLDKIEDLNIVQQENSKISWTKNGTTQNYVGISENDKIIKDFGIALRMKNPFDSSQKSVVCLFCGCHTYGTIAATRYFTEHYIKKAKSIKRMKESVIMLIECDVINGFPVNLKLREEHEF